MESQKRCRSGMVAASFEDSQSSVVGDGEGENSAVAVAVNLLDVPGVERTAASAVPSFHRVTDLVVLVGLCLVHPSIEAVAGRIQLVATDTGRMPVEVEVISQRP